MVHGAHWQIMTTIMLQRIIIKEKNCATRDELSRRLAAALTRN
jgi:hypothetical protein